MMTMDYYSMFILFEFDSIILSIVIIILVIFLFVLFLDFHNHYIITTIHSIHFPFISWTCLIHT